MRSKHRQKVGDIRGTDGFVESDTNAIVVATKVEAVLAGHRQDPIALAGVDSHAERVENRAIARVESQRLEAAAKNQRPAAHPLRDLAEPPGPW